MRFPLLLLLCFLGLPVRAGEFDVNPYATSYQQRREVSADTPAVDQVKMFRGEDKERDYLRLLEDGYELLGSSSFKSGTVPPEQAQMQARKVKADVVMVYTNHFGKTPNAIRMEAARHRLRTNTESASSEAQPINIQNSYAYYATYWVKLPPPLLGLHVNDRSRDDKTPGAPVVAVIKNSPAANAGLRRGDAVLRIGATETNNGDALVNAVREQAGKTVELAWLRDGAVMHTSITLGTR